MGEIDKTYEWGRLEEESESENEEEFKDDKERKIEVQEIDGSRSTLTGISSQTPQCTDTLNFVSLQKDGIITDTIIKKSTKKKLYQVLEECQDNLGTCTMSSDNTYNGKNSNEHGIE